MRDWMDVATLAKTKNLKGRFVAKAAAGLPFILEEGDEVALVPPKHDVPRNVVVSDVVLVDDLTAEICFEGLDDPAIAGELVGMHCLIRRDGIDGSCFEEVPGMWQGWIVVDEKAGRIGEIVGIADNGAQQLLEVDHDGRTVLVPAVDEIVVDVDVQVQEVRVALPNGLLEL